MLYGKVTFDPLALRTSFTHLRNIFLAPHDAPAPPGRHASVLETYGTTVHFILVPISTLGDGIRTPIAQWGQLSLQLRREQYSPEYRSKHCVSTTRRFEPNVPLLLPPHITTHLNNKLQKHTPPTTIVHALRR